MTEGPLMYALYPYPLSPAMVNSGKVKTVGVTMPSESLSQMSGKGICSFLVYMWGSAKITIPCPADVKRQGIHNV